MGFFKSFIIDKFPYYYREEDTYKDSSGKGIFTRFVETSGEELDDNVIPLIKESLDQKVAYDKDGKHVRIELLDYLNQDLGGIYRSILSEEDYRRLMANILSIYKNKGNQKSYELLFYFFGYYVTGFNITSEISVIHDQYNELGLEDILHDTDIGGEPIIHDRSCFSCIEYDLVLTPIPGSTGYFGVSPSEVYEVVKLVEPLWAKLTTVNIEGITTGLTSSDDLLLITFDDIALSALI